MKKRTISILLIALLVTLMLPINVSAADTLNLYVSISGNDENSGDESHPLQTLDAAMEKIGEDVTGKITLLSNITLYTSQNIDSNKTVILDLYGHNINMTNTADKVSIFKVSGNLTIDNSLSSSVAVITSGSQSVRGVLVEPNGIFHLKNGTISTDASENDFAGAGVFVSNNGIFTMHGGIINSCHSTTNGAGVYVDESAAFNMYDGKINSCSIVNTGNDASGNGGGVYIASKGSFNMEGGCIDNNSCPAYGAGVYISPESSFNMRGGTIKENASKLHTVANFGAFSMIGGEIINNSSQSTDFPSYAVYVSNTANTLLGNNAKIIDNDNKRNLELDSGAKISIGTGSFAPNGMLIGLHMAEPGTFTTNPATNQIYFFVAQNGNDYKITYNPDDTLVMAKVRNITISNIENGNVSTSKNKALIGDNINVTVTPDENFVLKSLCYNDGENDVNIEENSGVYSFIMPDKDITIKAVFDNTGKNVPSNIPGGNTSPTAGSNTSPTAGGNISPATGDFNYSFIWILIFIVGAGAISGISIYRNKK